MSDQQASPCSFYELLADELLGNRKLTASDLHDFVAARETRMKPEEQLTPAAVKERFRVARANNLRACEFPLLPHIVQFFEERGKPDAAQIIRHIVSQQHKNQGLGILSFDEGAADRPKLDWLRFPVKKMDHGDDLARSEDYLRWKHYVSDGDYSFYRTSLQLFYSLKGSPCHAHVRAFIAPRMARTAVNYGDYADAYIICKRLEDAWEARRDLLKPEESERYHLSKNAIYSYLDAVQMKAVAAANIFPAHMIQAAMKYFDKARKFIEQPVTGKLDEHGLDEKSIWGRLPEESRQKLTILFYMRLLRCHCKHLSSYLALSSDSSKLEESRLTAPNFDAIESDIRALEAYVADENGVREEHRDVLFNTYDTLARCKAMLSLAASWGYLDDVESATDRLEQGREYFDASLRWRHTLDIKEKEYRGYKTSSLRITRYLITDILVNIAHSVQTGKPVRVSHLFSFLVDSLSPSRLRHNIYVMYLLERLIDMANSKIAGGENPNAGHKEQATRPSLTDKITPGTVADPLMSDDAVRAAINNIDKQASQFKEDFFTTSPDSPEHLKSLYQAYCFSKCL